VPLAVFQGITGLLLIWKIGFELLSRGWLLLAIALYVVVLANSFLVLLPTLGRLLEATAAPPPPPPAGAAPTGPPPHVRALARRGRMAGMLNATLIVVIIFLMVAKPF
jgi:uncharacterized membrane protein